MQEIERFSDNIRDIRIFNDYMGIDMIEPDQMVEFLDGLKDMGDSAELPGFLEKSLVAGFNPSAPSLEEDYRLRTIFGFLPGNLSMPVERSSYYEKLWKDWAAEFKGIHHELLQSISDISVKISDTSDGPVKDKLRLEKSQMVASAKEMNKLQLLIGAPLFHHVLSVETHYEHEMIPSGFRNSKLDFGFVDELGKLMRSKSSYSSESREFKLPIGTSQGLTLKSARDTGMWRAFSKVLLALYAVKSTSLNDLRTFKSRLNEVMSKNGFSNIAEHSFLGLRRQQINYDKGEPFCDIRSFTSGGYLNVGVTRMLQGRARAIFPFSETIKAWFKPLADGVKKHLFLETSMHATNPVTISNCLHKITELSLTNQLFDDEGNFLCFYDLSAYDRTTHQGLNSLYNRWLSVYDPNFNSMYKDMHDDAGVVYPGTCDKFPRIFIEMIEGRSTLSGQADVTVKNNIIHLIVICAIVAHIKKKSPIDVANSLLYNEGPLKDDFIGLVHGDDAAVYFSDNKADYIEFARLFTELGIVTGFEPAPVYLKKTVKYENAQSMKSVPLSNVKAAKESLVHKKGDASKTFKPESYNWKYMYGLTGIMGSLLKNRFGEYSQSDIILAILSLTDTYKMLNDKSQFEDGLNSLYSVQLRILLDYWDDCVNAGLETKIISGELDDAKTIIEKLKKDGLSKCSSDATFQSSIADYMKSSIQLQTPKSVQMRATISKIVHTLGEEFLDESMNEIYSLMSYDVVEEAEILGIKNLSKIECLDVICEFQSFILENEGECPSNDKIEEILSKYKIKK